MKKVEQDVAQMRRELTQSRDEQQRALSRLDQIERQVNEAAARPESVSRADLADLTFQLNQVARDLSNVDQRVNDLGTRIQGVAQDASQAREYARTAPSQARPDDSVVSGGELTEGAQPDAEALYNTAYTDYAKGNYALAISGFEEYQESFPDRANADNALYWVAECRLSQGDFSGAIAGLDNLLSRYPDSDTAAAANLKKGLTYLEQNDIQKAILQLRYVNTQYSGTDEGKIARDKLASLGAPV
jgi:tol-pal system protein YbgF